MNQALSLLETKTNYAIDDILNLLHSFLDTINGQLEDIDGSILENEKTLDIQANEYKEEIKEK